jgi:hypothetical protein
MLEVSATTKPRGPYRGSVTDSTWPSPKERERGKERESEKRGERECVKRERER